MGKSFEGEATFDVQALEPISITNPVLVFQTSFGLQFNYVRIPKFNNRRYFVEDITMLDGNRMQVTCKVDVLESFKADIKNIKAIVNRAESAQQKLIADSQNINTVDRLISTKKIAGGFKTASLTNNSQVFTLNIAGIPS